MTPDVTKAEYIADYKIKIYFENGKDGIVDFSYYINSGGIFTILKDMEYFKKFYVDPEIFILTWPNHIEIAPEEIYSVATGEPFPSWVNDESEYSKVV